MSTVVILIWISGNDPFTDPPDDILGPFTEGAAKLITTGLQCHNRVRRITTTIPEWATS